MYPGISRSEARLEEIVMANVDLLAACFSHVALSSLDGKVDGSDRVQADCGRNSALTEMQSATTMSSFMM